MIRSTKSQSPPIYKQYVNRSRLNKLLNEILDHPFTLISAPPGSGKTSLLSHWINQLSPGNTHDHTHSIWLTLDGQDNDPYQFWSRILSASLNSTQKNNLNLMLNSTTAINTILESWMDSIVAAKTEVVLVLDDYHQIQEPVIQNSVLYALEHTPNNLHIVVCSRIDPPFPLSKWRIQGKLVEIRSADLSFTPTEISDFFQQQNGVNLNSGQKDEIFKRTEGWAAGLQAIALSIKDLEADKIDQRISGFSGKHRYFADYVTDEIITHLPVDVLGFLTTTSILNKLSAPLCASVLEHSDYASVDAQKTLLHILQNNLYLTSLDEENEWFRLHPLFQELLQSKLRSEKPSSFIDVLNRTAAKWFFLYGDLNEAINLSMAAHDPHMTADMINATVEKADIWSVGEIGTILKWIRSLPVEIVHQRPWLQLYQSRALYVSGNIVEAESILDQIETNSFEKDIQLLAQINSSRARISAVKGQIQLAINYAQLALNALSPDFSLAHSSALSSMGYAYLLAGQLEESMKWLNSALNEAKNNGFLLLQVNILVNKGWIYYLQGQNDKLESLIHQGLLTCQIGKQLIPIAGLLFLLLAEYQYDQGAIEKSHESLTRGLSLLEQGGIEDSSQKSLALMAKIQSAKGDEQNAWQCLEQASERVKQSGLERSIRFIESTKADFWLHHNHIDQAAKWAAYYQSLDSVDYQHETEDIVLAKTLLAVGEIKKCVSICKNLEQHAENNGLIRMILEANLILAMAFHASKQIDSSQAAFLKALILAETLHSRQPFIDEIKSLHPVLIESNKRGVKIELLNDLVDLQKSAASSTSQLIQPLSDREIEVIQLIAEGRTNQEIAESLVIAETTVKKHISHIFDKLNVTNRTQVIIAARQLKIV